MRLPSIGAHHGERVVGFSFHQTGRNSSGNGGRKERGERVAKFLLRADSKLASRRDEKGSIRFTPPDLRVRLNPAALLITHRAICIPHENFSNTFLVKSRAYRCRQRPSLSHNIIELDSLKFITQDSIKHWRFNARRCRPYKSRTL